MEQELILRDLYYSHKLGFRSAQHIYELAKKEDPSITLTDVRKWLNRQKAYSKHKKYNNPKHFRHTFVRYLGEQIQMDLITYMKKYTIENDGYGYILAVVEILSRFAFTVPVKTKSGKEAARALETVFEKFRDRFHLTPKLVQTDTGGEFINKDVKRFLEDQDVENFFFTTSKRKASIVERFNRTLKEKINKHFEANVTNRWIDKLEYLTENYNTQEHRSIGMSPSEVNVSNQFTVWGRLYGSVIEIREPKFEIGDLVRILNFDLIGQKKKFINFYKEEHPEEILKTHGVLKDVRSLQTRDKPHFSEEVFRIDEILFGDPIVYKLYSEEAEVDIMGKFYEEELTLAGEEITEEGQRRIDEGEKEAKRQKRKEEMEKRVDIGRQKRRENRKKK